MVKMVYNASLARMAQAAANTCSWKHTASAHGSGDNLFRWSQTGYAPKSTNELIEMAILNWAGEKLHYRYRPMTESDKPFGHYTQMIWAKSTSVGCGVAKCNGRNNGGWESTHHVKCWYYPQGNILTRYPYEYGRRCGSACPAGKTCVCR